MAALVVLGKPQHLGFHFQDSVEVSENGVLDRPDIPAQLAQHWYGGGNLVVNHLGIVLALLLAPCSLFLFLFLGTECFKFPAFLSRHFYFFHFLAI